MLVLSRKANESVKIGSGIEVTVIAVNGNRVKLGFEAPDSVRIVRTELLTIAPGWKAVEAPSGLPNHEQLGETKVRVAK